MMNGFKNLIIGFLIVLICLLISAIYFQAEKIRRYSVNSVKYNSLNYSETDHLSRSSTAKPIKEAVNHHNKFVSKIYYIDSVAGDNTSSGISIDSAWRDFSNVNKRHFSKGDRILLKRGGVWHKTLLTPAGGDNDCPIIIDAYGSGPLPVIDVQNKYSSAIRIYHSYISINNIIIKNSGNDCLSISISGGLKNVKLRNIKIFNAGNNGIGVSKGGSGLIISQCYIKNADNNGIYLGGSAENKLSNVIVKNCHIEDILHNDGITIHEDGMGNTAGSNFLFKNNVSERCGEQGFDITSGRDILLLNNTSKNNKEGGILVGHSAQQVTIKGHISENEPTESTASAIYLLGDHGNIRILNSIIRGNGYHLLSVHTNNVAVFNNDFIWNGGGSPIDIEGRIDNIYFINNIVYSKQLKMGRIRFLDILRPPDYTGFHFDYNLYYVPNAKVIFYYNQRNYGFRDYQKVFNVEPHSKNINPEFVDPFQNNYQLKSSSPAIDSGCFYTHPLSKDVGSAIYVSNALFFHKKFGTNEYQRVMFKGIKGVFNIVDVDYKTNTIYLNKKIQCDRANSIGLCYKKSSLDIGAYEFVHLPLSANDIKGSSNEKNYDN